MRPRPGETPQNSGRRFERFWAKIFGTEPQPGSGNQWFARMDVADGAITWSLKWTSHESFSITKKLLREVDHAIKENGDNSIPGIAMSIDNGTEVIIAMRLSDFQRLLTDEQSIRIRPTKGEEKRINSRVPLLLRDEDPTP